MSKNQIFWDGNKRCALISANALMYKYGVGLLSIPEADFITSMNIYPITTTATRLVKKDSCFILCMIIVSLALTTNLKQTYLADS